MVVLILALALQTPPPSLGDLARKARESKENADTPKAKHVYTTDEMKPGTVESKPTVATKTPAKTNLVELEKKYRNQFAALRSDQARAEARAKTLSDEMLKASPSTATVVHYYYDPKYLKQLQTSIDANNAQLAVIKKRLSALSAELDDKGYPSEWGEPQ